MTTVAEQVQTAKYYFKLLVLVAHVTVWYWTTAPRCRHHWHVCGTSTGTGRKWDWMRSQIYCISTVHIITQVHIKVYIEHTDDNLVEWKVLMTNLGFGGGYMNVWYAMIYAVCERSDNE